MIGRFNNRCRRVFEEIRDPLIFVDTEGRIRGANSAARASLDLGTSGLIKDVVSLEKSFAFDPADIIPMIFRDAPVYGHRLKDAEGNLSNVAVDILNVGKSRGRKVKLIHIKDFSSYHKYERWKDELISMVAHEIKNPLAAMKNSLSILLGQGPGPVTADQQNFLTMSIRNVDRLTRLLDGFLDVSRINSGKHFVEPEWIDASDFIADVVGSFRTLFNVEKGKIDYSVSAEVGRIYVDASKLEQVLINLLSNGLKFTHRDGHIHARVEPSSVEILDDDLRILPWNDIADLRFVRFVVSDNGIGMTEDTLSHLFTRYYPGGAGNGMSGAHLGLSISKTLIEVQNGRLEIESRLGVGTEVTVSLPEDDVTATILRRLSAAQDCLTEAVSSGGSATFYTLRKNDGSNWEDLFRGWAVQPVVDRLPEGEKRHVFTVWTLGEKLAVGVFIDEDRGGSMKSVFGSLLDEEGDRATHGNGYSIGRTHAPEDGTRVGTLIYSSLKRMSSPVWVTK